MKGGGGGSSDWFSEHEEQIQRLARVHACDAEAASCEAEQLRNFKGRAPPRGCSAPNSLIFHVS